MTTNNERLRELMKKHDLSRQDVSGLLHLAVTKNGQTPAVAKWLAHPTDSSNFRSMNDALIELLEYKLGEKRVSRFKPRKKVLESQ